jgi:glycosyltransferase involved in cell wall biosynthesis
MTSSRMTVGIVADLPEGLGGGVNLFTRALVRSMGASLASDMRLVVFTAKDDVEWVPASDQVAVVGVERFSHQRGWTKWQERAWRYGQAALSLAQLDPLGAQVNARFGERTRRLLLAVRRAPWPLDVMHFPFQSAVPVGVPVIFGLWDLQHLHLPELRPPHVTAQLDRYYRWCVRGAARVTFGSDWARQDAIERYHLTPAGTLTVHAASPLRFVAEPSPALIAAVRAGYALPARFAFYPAATWPHKNHRRLIAALATLQDAAVSDLHVVCSGQSGRHREQLMQHAADLGVQDRVHFIGHVADDEVKALYRLAEFCIFPSLFEGAGLPVLEAFDEGCPVAASSAGSIPEYAADAALLFDPADVDAIASAMRRMTADDGLRAQLAARGAVRARHFSWERVVASYQTLYRELARAPHETAAFQAHGAAYIDS